MRCLICQKEFIPNKYRPAQKVCSSPDCQKKRQVQNERAWRDKNPEYFKYLDQELAWRSKRKRYSRLWRSSHKKDLQIYEKEHQQQRKEYMRDYMRNYRQVSQSVVNRNKS